MKVLLGQLSGECGGITMNTAASCMGVAEISSEFIIGSLQWTAIWVFSRGTATPLNLLLSGSNVFKVGLGKKYGLCIVLLSF